MSASSHARPSVLPRVQRWIVCALLALSGHVPAWALDIRFDAVAPGVYAFIGETGPRTQANQGLNANLGLVVTPAGALLIDSGASYLSARDIHRAIQQVTPQPVRWLINTGGQDHRWLGNGYFIEQGVEVIAHASARADMLARGPGHLASLADILQDRLQGTHIALPTRFLQGQDEALELGGVRVEVKHRGGGHTPGDSLVWLPAQKLLFTGDVVYADRLLGIFPFSNTRHWLASFTLVEQLQPDIIVPGHGRVSDLARARADTGDYLRQLRAHMRHAVDEMVGLTESIRSFDATPYLRLHHATELHPGNASRTYLEIERDQVLNTPPTPSGK